MRSLAAFLLLLLAATVPALTVKQHTSYTTRDEVTAREAVFVLQLKLDKEGETLFGFVDGKIVPVAVNGDDYQVSWTLPHSKAKVGDHVVRFFDESGYDALVKYVDGEGEEPVSKLTVSVPHKAVNKSKLPISPSLIAIALAFVALIGAKSSKTAAEGGH